MAWTDGTQLFVGGDFTTVNGAVQQGFAASDRVPATRRRRRRQSPW